MSVSVIYAKVIVIAKYLQLLDKEDEEGVVEDNYQNFQKMYQPVWKDNFANYFDLSDGKFTIDRNDKAAKKMLAMHINDNVLKNIDRFSILLFDEKNRLKKQETKEEERVEIVEKLIEQKNFRELLNRSVDKILLAHRNTKLFLFMMTGPFLILMQTIKYSIKGLVFLYLYRKHKSLK